MSVLKIPGFFPVPRYSESHCEIVRRFAIPLPMKREAWIGHTNTIFAIGCPIVSGFSFAAYRSTERTTEIVMMKRDRDAWDRRWEIEREPTRFEKNFREWSHYRSGKSVERRVFQSMLPPAVHDASTILIHLPFARGDRADCDSSRIETAGGFVPCKSVTIWELD